MPRMSRVKSISAKPAVVLRVSLRSGGVKIRGDSKPNRLGGALARTVGRAEEREFATRCLLLLIQPHAAGRSQAQRVARLQVGRDRHVVQRFRLASVIVKVVILIADAVDGAGQVTQHLNRASV